MGKQRPVSDVMNLSVHPVKGGLLEWFLLDGTGGSMASASSRAGLGSASMGMLHKVEPFIDIMALPHLTISISEPDRALF